MSASPRRSIPSASPRPRIYRRHFTPAECLWLDRLSDEDGRSELNLLRVLLSRVIASAAKRRVSSWSGLAALLSVFSLSTLNIAALVRIRLDLSLDDLDPRLDPLAALDLEDL